MGLHSKIRKSVKKVAGKAPGAKHLPGMGGGKGASAVPSTISGAGAFKPGGGIGGLQGGFFGGARGAGSPAPAAKPAMGLGAGPTGAKSAVPSAPRKASLAPTGRRAY